MNERALARNLVKFQVAVVTICNILIILRMFQVSAAFDIR